MIDVGYETPPARYFVGEGEPILTGGAPSGRSLAKEALRSPEQIQSEAYSRIRKDLYLSFMVSQGNDADQELWLRAAAAYYKNAWPTEYQDALPAAVARMNEVIAVTDLEQKSKTAPPLQTPGKHRPAVDKFYADKGVRAADQFSKHWRTMRDWIRDTESSENGPQGLEIPMSEVADLANGMLVTDLKYQREARKGGYMFDKDPHASLFRTHVIEGISTGSEAYDAVCGTIRGMFESVAADESLQQEWGMRRVTRSLERLRTAWQEKHPGQSFEGAADQPRELSPRALQLLGTVAGAAATAAPEAARPDGPAEPV